MSDAYFDGLRASGEYPPKGWGWKCHGEQIRCALNFIKNGVREPWLIEYIEQLDPNDTWRTEFLKYHKVY